MGNLPREARVGDSKLQRSHVIMLRKLSRLDKAIHREEEKDARDRET